MYIIIVRSTISIIMFVHKRGNISNDNVLSYNLALPMCLVSDNHNDNCIIIILTFFSITLITYHIISKYSPKFYRPGSKSPCLPPKYVTACSVFELFKNPSTDGDVRTRHRNRNGDSERRRIDRNIVRNMFNLNNYNF